MSNKKVKDIVLIALFSAIIVVCSLITIPSAIPFTLQTFGVFLALNLLGAKRGLASISIYILLGVIGLPVFSGFQGGIGVLFNITGGYILGFVFSALTFWFVTKLFNKNPRKIINLIASFLGLFVCYTFGTAWYILFSGENLGFLSAITICVLPFIIPDIIKILLATLVTNRIKKLNLF